MLRLPAKSDYIKIFRAILAEPKDKLRVAYEVKVSKVKKFVPSELRFKSFKADSKSLKDCYEFSRFFSAAASTYQIYDMFKSVSSFNVLIKKLKGLSASDVVTGFPDKPYYNFSIGCDKGFLKYFELYVVAKWLGLKPNNNFKPVFKMVAKDLKDKEWWLHK